MTTAVRMGSASILIGIVNPTEEEDNGGGEINYALTQDSTTLEERLRETVEEFLAEYGYDADKLLLSIDVRD